MHLFTKSACLRHVFETTSLFHVVFDKDLLEIKKNPIRNISTLETNPVGKISLIQQQVSRPAYGKAVIK